MKLFLVIAFLSENAFYGYWLYPFFSKLLLNASVNIRCMTIDHLIGHNQCLSFDLTVALNHLAIPGYLRVRDFDKKQRILKSSRS